MKSFRENFLDLYLKMANDKIPEVRVAFLNYAPVIRPYFEPDVDLFLKFNNLLNTLQLDQSYIVSNAAIKANDELRKNKVQLINIINVDDEKAKQDREVLLSQRVKFEEELKKKKVEEPEDSKFDYLTLLVNTTKKYGNGNIKR
jgi:hypothetical protein